MSEFKSLLLLLQKETRQQEKLLELLTKERAAIVGLQREEIEALSKKKEDVLLGSREIEKERSELITSLFPEKGKEGVKFDDILNLLEDGLLKRDLSKTGAELKRVVKAVQKLNTHNGQLIRQTMGLVASTISIIRSAPQTGLPTYGPSGKLAAEAESRKVGYTRKA